MDYQPCNHHLLKALAVTLGFGLWAVVFNILVVIYISNTLKWKDHFQLRVQAPSIMILELVTLSAVATAIAIREVASAWGASIPCYIQDVAFFLSLGAYIVIFPLRSLQIIVIFDPEVRKSYFNLFKRVKIFMLTIIMFSTFAILLMVQSGEVKGCQSMCGRPGCIWGSRWMISLSYGAVFYTLMAPLLYKMYKLKIHDRAGIVADMRLAMMVIALCLSANTPLTILVDFAVLPIQPYYTIISLITLISMSVILFIGYVNPARRHRLSPTFTWKETGNKIAHITLATMVHAASKRRLERLQRISASNTPASALDLNVAEILSCPTTKDMFISACREHFVEEAVMFILAVREARSHIDYHKEGNNEQLIKIYTDFIKPGSIYEIPMPMSFRIILIEDLGPRQPNPKCKGGSKGWLNYRNMIRRQSKKKVFVMARTLDPLLEEGEDGEAETKSVELSTIATSAPPPSPSPAPQAPTEKTCSGSPRGTSPGEGNADSTRQSDIDLHLLAAVDLMEDLLTRTVLPTLQQNQDFKTLCAAMSLESHAEPCLEFDRMVILEDALNIV